MTTCRTCGSDNPVTSRFCSACGGSLAAVEFETRTVASRPVLSRSSPLTPPSGPIEEGRFVPGTLLGGRYRVVALLGRGGMGEVYRANDLTLGQPVALKFLPEEAALDEAARARFQNEVRIARQVSHPNVCRVYDLGEVDGHLYISMEYVDGEHLGSLLRRIGRLPGDKALEIARKVCAGLAAAHDKGVLHRDLKPANVMLDSRGQVLITDFGLAALADQIQAHDVRHGTPAYMAPEQLAGKEVSVKSDLYALGLLLYELFTGKRAFEASTLAELVRMQSESAPASPATLVKDLDPAVERVILRCLDPDPANRPASALAVAAALPGGDPLAAALAAGETPSPQMVAAAGETSGLKPAIAVPCLLAVLIGLIAAVVVTNTGSMLARADAQIPPEALSQKARELISRIGYTAPPGDTEHGFDYETDYLNWVESRHGGWDQALAARPAPLLYWYRQSPRYLVARDFNLGIVPGVVTLDDPPPIFSGMITVQLDPQGRLVRFLAIPPQREEAPAGSAAVDWNPLFAAAGLDPARFQPAGPQWTSLASADARAAWTGTWPGPGNRPARVEAAAWRGKPVYFQLIGPWTKPDRMASTSDPGRRKTGAMVLIVLTLSMLATGSFMARRNYLRGRGDRRGGFRLAFAVFWLQMAIWLLAGHHVLEIDQFGLLVLAISGSLFEAGAVWVFYLAVEPYVRRHWPQTIISWTRLLAGRLRDPLVGRDILFGVALGVAWFVILAVRQLVLDRLGGMPWQSSRLYLGGARQALSFALHQVPNSVEATLVFFLLIFLLRTMLRKQWLASAAFVLIFVVIKVLSSSNPLLDAVTFAAIYAIAAAVLMRFGLVSLAVGIVVTDTVASVPFTTDFSAWYAPVSLFVLLATAALAVYGFHTSLAGRKLFKDELFD